MSALFILAQTSPKDTSSSGVLVFGMVALVGVLSIVALTKGGRRSLMPMVAILLGLIISYSSVADAVNATFSVITILGLLIGVTLVLGGFGALREGVALPPVEGHDPVIEPQPPRITPADTDSTQSGAQSPEVR